MTDYTATVKAAPVRSILDKLFNVWKYDKMGQVWVDCQSTTIDLNIISVTWDGTNLIMVSSFNAPCTGKITQFRLYLFEINKNFVGLAQLGDINAPVSQGQAYTIYYTEVLNEPTTATVTGP